MGGGGRRRRRKEEEEEEGGGRRRKEVGLFKANAVKWRRKKEEEGGLFKARRGVLTPSNERLLVYMHTSIFRFVCGARGVSQETDNHTQPD